MNLVRKGRHNQTTICIYSDVKEESSEYYVYFTQINFLVLEEIYRMNSQVVVEQTASPKS